MKSLVGSLVNSLGSVKNAGPQYTSAKYGTRLPIFGTSDNRTSQMESFGSVSTLFSIVHRISNATSQIDWHLYRKSRTGRKEDREEVTSHLALDIWNKPNSFYTRQEFVESSQQYTDLTGESYWIVERSPLSDIPLGLWPVRPDRMVPVAHPTDYLSGWIYVGPDGNKIPFDINEVIQLRMPNPLDPYRGLGPVQALLTDLDSVKYSAEWNRNFFMNSAEPGGIIEVNRNLDDDEFNQLRDRWSSQHKGVANAHRVAILEQGKWVDRNFSQKDMQFAELRDVSRDIIREAYGMPKNMLGLVDDVNRSNAEAGEFVFGKWLVVPRLERIKGALNNDFLPMFGSTGQGLEWDYDSPVSADKETDNAERNSKATAVKTLVDAGFDPSEVLLAMGMPAMSFVGKGGLNEPSQ